MEITFAATATGLRGGDIIVEDGLLRPVGDWTSSGEDDVLVKKRRRKRTAHDKRETKAATLLWRIDKIGYTLWF